MKGTAHAFRLKVKTNKEVDVKFFDCNQTKMKEKKKEEKIIRVKSF